MVWIQNVRDNDFWQTEILVHNNIEHIISRRGVMSGTLWCWIKGCVRVNVNPRLTLLLCRISTELSISFAADSKCNLLSNPWLLRSYARRGPGSSLGTKPTGKTVSSFSFFAAFECSLQWKRVHRPSPKNCRFTLPTIPIFQLSCHNLIWNIELQILKFLIKKCFPSSCYFLYL